MTLSGESDWATITDSEGRYEFTNLENGEYMLIPTRIGTVFSPIFQSITVRDSDVTVNFSVSTGSGANFIILKAVF